MTMNRIAAILIFFAILGISCKKNTDGTDPNNGRASIQLDPVEDGIETNSK